MSVPAGAEIEHVSDTALWVASYRALESRRSDALFHDPLAEILAGERGPRIARRLQNETVMAWAIALRTRIMDELIAAAIAQGVKLALNLGAGLDARPYRMDLPASLDWVEVDYPHMVEFKEERLRGATPRCHLERISLDLTDLAARRELFASLGRQVLGPRLSCLGGGDPLRTAAHQAANAEGAISISTAGLEILFRKPRLAGERDALLLRRGRPAEPSAPVAVAVQGAEAFHHQKARADAPPDGGRRAAFAGRLFLVPKVAALGTPSLGKLRFVAEAGVAYDPVATSGISRPLLAPQQLHYG